MLIEDRTRNELWGLFFDLERNCRYYEVIHARSTRWFVLLRILALVLLAGGVVSIWNLLPFRWDAAIVSSILAVALAALTAVDFATNFPRKAAIALSIKISLAHLRADVERLWNAVDDRREGLTEEELRNRLREFSLQWQELEGIAGSNDILTDDKLNRKTSQVARIILEERYKFETTGT